MDQYAASAIQKKQHRPLRESSNMANTGRKYGFGNFILDVILTLITGGLWLIWIFVREMRNRR